MHPAGGEAPAAKEGHGVGEGASTSPANDGATKSVPLIPFRASVMNFFQMVAGNEPPVTLLP